MNRIWTDDSGCYHQNCKTLGPFATTNRHNTTPLCGSLSFLHFAAVYFACLFVCLLACLFTCLLVNSICLVLVRLIGVHPFKFQEAQLVFLFFFVLHARIHDSIPRSLINFGHPLPRLSVEFQDR